ncbi:TPA: hypothetical protein ACX6QT_000563 [Photobacterium damselae]|uniref:Uncharacterized protein n=1 Tax=Photobacterium sp. (strain ATCC 43367) TaxID=379097 RepID=A0A0A5JKK0_PHOS4|nr:MULTISPECIES: hypothetical protein [Vibrio]ELA7191286.1 hypothetical protein [Vibrio alginolyticus]HDY7662557.1 hypothetical protein [Vibrio vulnificus]EGR1274941.1 hypothetical protein [Vibrio parahaemolyticus]ELA3127290.1 hypothetical protein [Vibrio parahaemolyticus]KGY08448.1 hypothetical protein NM06_11900 [Vibrio sinaloensis]
MLEIAEKSLQNILDMIIAEPTLVIWLFAFIAVWLFVFRLIQSLKGQKLSAFNLKVSEYFELGLKFESRDSKSSTKSIEQSKDK